MREQLLPCRPCMTRTPLRRWTVLKHQQNLPAVGDVEGIGTVYQHTQACQERVIVVARRAGTAKLAQRAT